MYLVRWRNVGNVAWFVPFRGLLPPHAYLPLAIVLVPAHGLLSDDEVAAMSTARLPPRRFPVARVTP